MPKLVLRGINQGFLFELKPGSNRLGRNPANDCWVSEASLSSFHCDLTVTPDLVVVKDLGSTNGTFIDSTQIREGILKPGQTLRLGSAEFRLDEVSEAADEVRVAIPSVTIEAPRTHEILPDGAPACLNHPEVHASFQCTKCQETLCEECTHFVGLEHETPMTFCPVCGGPAQRMAPMPRTAGSSPIPKRRGKSVLGRLTETWKLPFKRGRDDSH